MTSRKKMRNAKPARGRQQTKESALRTLFRTYGLVQRITQPHFLRFGITSSQWGVLRVLDRAERNGEPFLRLNELGERLLVQPPSVTGIVSRLERMGLITKYLSASDRRAKELQLTPRGRALVAKVLDEHPAKIRSILSGLAAEEQLELQRLLEKLNIHIEGLTS